MSDQRKQKDRAKLERFRARVAGRQCAVDDCMKLATGGARYCAPHQRAHIALNNPLGRVPATEEYASYVEHVRRLLAANADHPAPAAGLHWLRLWLKRAVAAVASREPGATARGFIQHCPAELLAIKIIQRNVDLAELLVTLAAATAHLHKHGLANTNPGEFSLTLAAVALRVVGLLEDTKGKRTRAWGSTVAREFARLLEGELLKLLFKLAGGVENMLERERRMVQAIGRPLATPITYTPTGYCRPFNVTMFEEA